MKISDDFVLEKIDGVYCVFPIGTKTAEFSGIIRLNETGKFIWSALSVETELSDVVDAFAKHFSIDRQTAETDVTDFLTVLKQNNILE